MTHYNLDGISPTLPSTGRCWCAPDASLIGNIILGEEASVWFGVVLRGDNEPITVGPRSNIQDLSVVHTDPGLPVIIGEGCTIGHRAIIHGCTIGDNTLIGMGAIVLNGAVIGNNCLIGAGALIAENKVIADNSLVVGMPGKIVRAIDTAGEEDLQRSAAGYVANWKRFATGLKVIG